MYFNVVTPFLLGIPGIRGYTMQLCDKQIYEAMAKGDLLFVGANSKYPFKKDIQVQPASVDLRLGNRIMRFKDSIASFDINNIKDIKTHLSVQYVNEGEPIRIGPNEVIFAQIYEQISIPNYLSARIEGRSRVARLGISVHCTGDYINPGFAGAMPLQLINHNPFPVILYPYIDICQMILYELSGVPLISYLERSSLPYNTYYNETNPSPSILSTNVSDDSLENSIVAMRIRKLIENYYDTLEAEVKSNVKNSNRYQGPIMSVIDEATFSNYQNLFIGGQIAVGDRYIAKQAGIQGPGAGSHATITQYYQEPQVQNTDIPQLLSELDIIKQHLRDNFSDDDHYIIIGNVSSASKLLKENKNDQAMEFLKKSGKALYGIAKNIGCSVVARYLGNAIGL